MLQRRSFLTSTLVGLASLNSGLAISICCAAETPKTTENPSSTPTASPRVEVVFCLDTTGSMGGLIEGAKQKIWSICNQIAGGKPSPELKVGLVAYRDRGDEYVTRAYDLTEDLDAIYGHLKGFQAAGGGDFPESVNEALDVAVHKISWSPWRPDDETLRIIFLVGDAPPHMDYADDVKYPVTCEKACKKGIIINTVQCGTNQECTKFWQDICKKAEGQYVQIAQDGGVQVVATPFDRRLAEINSELSKSTLTFGDSARQAEAREKADGALRLAAPAAADRAAFNAKRGQAAAYDLLDAVKQGKVKLEEIKKEHLPEEMRKMSLAEQKAYLEKIEKQREELRREALELDKKRSEFLRQKLAESRGKDSFDQQVLEMLRSQARKAKVAY